MIEIIRNEAFIAYKMCGQPLPIGTISGWLLHMPGRYQRADYFLIYASDLNVLENVSKLSLKARPEITHEIGVFALKNEYNPLFDDWNSLRVRTDIGKIIGMQLEFHVEDDREKPSEELLSVLEEILRELVFCAIGCTLPMLYTDGKMGDFFSEWAIKLSEIVQNRK